jgi:fructokinase
MHTGVDMGGTKIEAAVLDASGRVLARERTPTPRGDYEATLQAVAALVERVEGDTGRDHTLGVGIPGSLSPATGRVRNANSTWLNGRPLQEDLQRVVGRPLRLANDANCFALSEARDGAGRGARVVFGVILGTGVGGGLALGGHVWDGASGVAGEWGHMPLPWSTTGEWPGPQCWCGRRGCVETWLAGPALARDHEVHSGDRSTPDEIARAAAAGAEAAEATLRRYEERLARALAVIVDVLDPDVIVLGGGLSKLDRLYDSVPRELAAHVFGDVVTVRVLKPQHGDSSGVRGAAWIGAEAS